MSTTTTSSPAATPHLLTPPPTLSAPMYRTSKQSSYFTPTKPPKSTPRSTPTPAKSTPTYLPASEPSSPTLPLLPRTADSPPNTETSTTHHRPRTRPPPLTIPLPSPTPPHHSPSNPAISQLTPSLFLGDLHAATTPALQQSHGITHILSLLPITLPESKEHPVTWLSLPLLDTEDADLLSILPRAVEWVEAAVKGGGRVLVHCRAGVSRSAAVVVAWWMLREGRGVEEGLEWVGARRKVDLNLGFLGQLKRWEEMLREGEGG